MGAIRSASRRGGGRSAARLGPALAVCVALAGAACGGEDAPETSLPGAVHEPPRPAPALRLTRGDGGTYDIAGDRGRFVLVFFGFTRCPDICPATLERWVRVRRALGDDAERVRFLFVSVDPKRDTPDVAASYAAGFDTTFVGVSGTEREVGETALAWGVAATRANGGDNADYDVVHASQVFVVDAEGLLRWGYGRSVTAEEIAAGIRSLLRPRS
jgi:protein SCO1/2